MTDLLRWAVLMGAAGALLWSLLLAVAVWVFVRMVKTVARLTAELERGTQDDGRDTEDAGPAVTPSAPPPPDRPTPQSPTQGFRAHTKCVDAHSDGRSDLVCPRCKPLLGRPRRVQP